MAMDLPTPPIGPSGNVPDPPADARRPAGGAFRFVVAFVLLVLPFFAAYRFSLDTPANDWYLFQGARHTAWILDFVGYRAELEKSARANLTASEVRAALGQPEPASRASAPPLTPWETWQYRARAQRKNPDKSRIVGPQVVFVLRPGLEHELEALEARRDDARGNPGADALNARIRELRTTQAAGMADPELRRSQQGLFYSFYVIPECGAIEVMAIFLAAVLAFPTGWRARAWGLGLGLPVLYVVNLLRLSCLACIGALDAGGAWFAFFHEYVWQAVYVVFVVILWMVWVDSGGRRAPR